MKKKLFIFGSICIVVFVFVIVYSINIIMVLSGLGTNQDKNYPDKISYDGRYKMQVTAEELAGSKYAQIVITNNSSDEEVFIVEKAYRTFDLKWITWENNTNNFWVKSSDVGTFCYVYCEDEEWKKYSLKRKDDSFFMVNCVTNEQEMVRLEDLQEKIPQDCQIEY